MALSANAFATDRHTLITVQIPDPAAGNPVQYRVPNNEVIQVVGVKLTLATEIAVVERRVRILLVDSLGASPIQASVSSFVQNASLTWDYWFSCGIVPVDDSDHEYQLYNPLACGLQLQEVEQLSIQATGIQPNDQISDIYIRFYGWKMN
jgi:hypothetical protein